MNRALWLAPAAVMGLVIVASAGKAAAELNTTNGCSGSGVFRSNNMAVDAEAIGTTVVVIPRTDTVDWKGSVTDPPGVYSGSIKVDLPPPFDAWTVDTWKGDSQNTSNFGARHYNLPKLVPAEVEFQVRGFHTDENGDCNGFVNLKIDGGPFDSPVTPVSLVATLATGAGLFGTIRPLFRRGASL